MNYQSHLNNLKQDILKTLTCDKQTLVVDFLNILKKASRLLKNQDEPFSFWLQELSAIDPKLIPITRHAITSCTQSWIQYMPNRPTLVSRLNSTCEKLFTYWEYDDVCSTYQSQFYFYKNKIDGTVFKSSDFGVDEFITKNIDFNNDFELGIALISDLEKVITLKDLY